MVSSYEIERVVKGAVVILADAIKQHGKDTITAAKIQANGRAYAVGDGPIHRDVDGRR